MAGPVRRPERAARHAEHRHPHLFVGDDGSGVGQPEESQPRPVPSLHGGDHPLRCRVHGGQGLRVRRQVLTRPRAGDQQFPRTLFRVDRPSRFPRPCRDGRERVLVGSRHPDVAHAAGAVHKPYRGGGHLLALSRPGLDFLVPGAVSVMSDVNHSVDVKPYIAVFGALMVLTLVTVAISYLKLPATSTVLLALVIATTKATLVAMYFMHLKSERAMVYWPLALTAFLFVGLLGSLIWSEGDHLFGARFTDAFSHSSSEAPAEGRSLEGQVVH